MAFLTPDRTRVEYGLLIKEKLVPDGSRLKAGKPLAGGKPEWVTVHNTEDIREAAGTNDAEQYTRATFNGNMRDVVPHYYIDETDCWQLLREDEVGWHAGTYDGNYRTLGVEIIMDGSGSADDVFAEERGTLLAAALLRRHGLGLDRLTTHRRWSGKYCPAYILPHWEAFVARVGEHLTAMDETEPTPEPEPVEKVLYRVQVGAYAVRANAERQLEKVKAAGFADAFIAVSC